MLAWSDWCLPLGLGASCVGWLCGHLDALRRAYGLHVLGGLHDFLQYGAGLSGFGSLGDILAFLLCGASGLSAPPGVGLAGDFAAGSASHDWAQRRPPRGWDILAASTLRQS